MDRTLRAAAVAALFGLVAVGGIAWFLGMPGPTALASGVGAAVAFGGLIVLAARRAEQFDRPPEDPSGPSRGGPDER